MGHLFLGSLPEVKGWKGLECKLPSRLRKLALLLYLLCEETEDCNANKDKNIDRKTSKSWLQGYLNYIENVLSNTPLGGSRV